MSQVMSSQQWDVLCKVEQYWFKKEDFPATSWLATKTGLDQVTVVEALSSPLVKQSLEARGIPLFSDLEEDLNPRQIACINLVLNVADRRTLSMKLQALGIPASTYYAWKKQKPFSDALKKQGERLFGDTQAEVHVALTKQAIDGDINAIKLYNQMSGRFDSAKSVEKMNVQFVMMKLLEVIQKHVRDPEALKAIAGEFGALMSDGQKELE